MGSFTRKVLAGAATAGLVSAIAIALAFAQSGGSTGTHRRPHLTERSILRIAEAAAARAGYPYPRLIQHSEGTRHDANLVDSGDGVPGGQWSYLIAERGNFSANDVSLPAFAKMPHGSVLTLIVNASTGAVTDSGVSNRYPHLAKLGPVHTDLRETERQRRMLLHRIGTSGYAVNIQAAYGRGGNPVLVAGFYPNGSLAKPRWTICTPPRASACRQLKTSQLLMPGPTPSGTVFRASATFRGRTFTARSATWGGAVRAVRPPRLQGQARVGASVSPRAASWLGGWRAVPGYTPPLGMDSGGRGPSFDSLSVEACRTASGQHCVNLTPQGQVLDFAQRPVIVDRRFTGWFLFAFDERFSPDTGFAQPLYFTFAIPPLKVGATVARSAPIGPVRG